MALDLWCIKMRIAKFFLPDMFASLQIVISIPCSGLHDFTLFYWAKVISNFHESSCTFYTDVLGFKALLIYG